MKMKAIQAEAFLVNTIARTVSINADRKAALLPLFRDFA